MNNALVVHVNTGMVVKVQEHIYINVINVDSNKKNQQDIEVCEIHIIDKIYFF